jgi:hypothetical protein
MKPERELDMKYVTPLAAFAALALVTTSAFALTPEECDRIPVFQRFAYVASGQCDFDINSNGFVGDATIKGDDGDDNGSDNDGDGGDDNGGGDGDDGDGDDGDTEGSSKGNNGHGNDPDGNDDSNPGKSNDPSDNTDADGTPGKSAEAPGKNK